MELSEVGEFGFIDELRSRVPSTAADVGIGDDAAVLAVSAGARLVAATDALVEDVHFRFDWSSPADVGFKAVSVNVSDLAAMGAEPRWVLLAVCAPASSDLERLRGVLDGVLEACGRYGTELVGGDMTAADRLVLSVTALGEVTGEPLLRSGAEPGDVLAVTGALGRAAVGVNLLLSQDPRKVSPEDALSCMDAHRRPVARVDDGRALRRAGAHAVLDLSDGLASDLRRMTERSGVGAEIDAERLPAADEARRVAEARGWDLERIVLGGGEDLELLAALPAGADRPDGLIEIGRVVDDGLWIVRDGRREPLPDAGWDHFRS